MVTMDLQINDKLFPFAGLMRPCGNALLEMIMDDAPDLPLRTLGGRSCAIGMGCLLWLPRARGRFYADPPHEFRQHSFLPSVSNFFTPATVGLT